MPTICSPFTSIDPLTVASTGNRPIIARAIIDLPEPDEPIRPTRWPSRTSICTSETIGAPPMRMVRWLTETPIMHLAIVD